MNVVFLGSAKSGKTSIIGQLMHGIFDHRYKPTVEESYNFVVQQPDGLSCILNVFDTYGSDEFPVMRELRIQQSDVCVVVYSVTCRASFDYAMRMCQTVWKIKENHSFPIVLVGNKTDKTSKRVVMYEDGYKIMQDCQGCYFVETSARISNKISRIMDIVLLQRDDKQDKADMKHRLSSINIDNRVSDPSVRMENGSDPHSLDLWRTSLLKGKKKNVCNIL